MPHFISNEVLSESSAPKDEHFPQARSLLAQELRAYYDHRIKDEDLTPEFDLPRDYQEGRGKLVFGFSLGAGLLKKTFVIRLEADSRGKPHFELLPEADPSVRALRLRGELNMIDKGRTQIERVLVNKRTLMN